MPDFTHTALADHTAFQERLNALPQQPGIYQWKNTVGEVLYVGKSKNLRDRMRSYFGSPRGLSNKTRRLVAQIADFDIIITQNELEALLLEMTLIKKHRPRYNILLKDDKSYPYIKITLQERIPRVLATRQVRDDGARYFGPYASARSVRTTLDLLNRLFAFRPQDDCSDSRFDHHKRIGKPCLYYDMKRCLAPCVPELVSPTTYRQAIDAVCRFLDGKSDQIVRELRQSMHQAAEDLQFERAAYLRDQIHAIERVLEKQQVLRTVHTDQDVVAFARENGSAVVQVLFIRGGKLIGTEPFTLEGTEDETDATLLRSFLMQFYDRAPEVPPYLLLADYVEEPVIIEQWLANRHGHKVEIQVPRRGDKRKLITFATQNASQKLKELRQQWGKDDQRLAQGLQELHDILGLPTPPQRIECYDISNTQGSQSVASMVVFLAGKAAPKAYRRFKIQTVVGANDVASIYEVVLRRFKRVARVSSPESPHADHPSPTPDDSARWQQIPDVLCVDGGIGQVAAAQKALQETGYQHVHVVGIAKGEDRKQFALVQSTSQEPLLLARDSAARLLIQQIDEEAHRFAITYHRSLRRKKTLESPLDRIPGVGQKRKRKLLQTFGSLDAIAQASVEELAAVPGMNRKIAAAIKNGL